MGVGSKVVKALAEVVVPPFHLKHWRWLRLAIFLTADLALLSLAYWGAFWLRLEDAALGNYFQVFLNTLPWLLLSHVLVFAAGGMYREVWRFANFKSAIRILSCVLYSTLLASLIIYGMSYWGAPTPPRSVPGIFFLLAAFFIGGEKFSWRAWTQFQRRLQKGEKECCVIYGAGSAGELFVRHILEDVNSPFYPVCFIDDDKNKQGRTISGLKIAGTAEDLTEVCRKRDASVVILAMPSAPGKVIREAVAECHKAGLKPLIMPDLSDSLGNQVVMPRIVNIEDLLRRAPKETDIDKIHEFFRGKVVLVSGAGGSIGSEICRQVLACEPKTMILVDNSELNLYQIDMELTRRSTKTKLVSLLASVTDKLTIEKIMTDHRPHCILHAAAYKHVPIVESNPVTGVKNNLLGTLTLSEAAVKFDVGSFILISTDKAVNPTNIMGASKRACERLVLALNALHGDKCKFSAVRFGNVLGSSGSVVPRFMEQIKSGGPVTVTHPEITRYFMLANEAVGLVLQAAIYSRGGEIFVLNMGEPVKIYEMAKHLIRLAGKEPGRDIEVSFSGLRPGEKLYEELILEGSERSRVHEDINILITREDNWAQILRKINDLAEAALSGNEGATVRLVREIAGIEPVSRDVSDPVDDRLTIH